MHSLENINMHSCFLILLPPKVDFSTSVQQERDEILKIGPLKTLPLRQGTGKLGSVLYPGASNSGMLFLPLGLKKSLEGVSKTVW